jgi:hypothetical protein
MSINIKEYIESKSNYLNSKTAVDGSVVTINEIRQENDIGEKKEEALVAHWQEAAVKPLILNKTNLLTLAELFGEQTDAMKGCRVGISVQPASFMGKLVPSVRLVAATAQPAS